MDIAHTAALARLKVPEDELEALSAEMTAILEMVAVLPPLPEEATLPAATPLREDEVAPSTPREVLMRGAPRTEADCFWVPRTVE